MKNLILKNKFKTKKVARWLVALFFLFSLFFLFNLFYNQNRAALSQDEEETKSRLLRGKEIPSIENVKKEIWGLIDDKNEDIRTSAEKSLYVRGLIIDDPLCPKITRIEAIERKLNKARNEFDKCYLPCSEWTKVFRGEKSGKFLMRCEMVMSQDFPRETKTEENGVPVCTSLHNYFCCY